MSDTNTIILSMFLCASVLGILFICTDLFWQFWDELDAEDTAELEKFLRGE